MLRRVIEKVQEVGVPYALALSFARVVPARVLSATRIAVLHLKTASTKLELPIGRWAGDDDLELLTGFGHTNATLIDRFSRGDRAWIAVEAGMLVGYCWFTTREYRDAASGVAFPAHPNEVWLYDAMVRRDQRGKGIYPRLLAGASRQLASEGTRGIWIVVEELNRNSIRAHEAGGAVVHQSIRVMTVFGRQWIDSVEFRDRH